MTTSKLTGFPLPDDYATTRIPNAVIGRALAEIENPTTIKVVLRAIWMLERERGHPKYISVEALALDRVVAKVVANTEELSQIIDVVAGVGIFVKLTAQQRPSLMLNTESAQRLVSAGGDIPSVDSDHAEADDGWGISASNRLPPDAFRAYEENIGYLSPMIRESILNALEDFNDSQITDAIKIAVENEARSWSFVKAVLRGWAREGFPNERGTSESRDRAEHRRISEVELRKYLEAQRKRAHLNS